AKSATMLPEIFARAVTLVAHDAGDLERQSFAELRDRISTWRSTATCVTRIAESAGLPVDAKINELRDALATLIVAWSADEDVGAHYATFNELGLALPATIDSHTGDDVLPGLRGALDFLAQFHEPGIPGSVVDWLTSGDPTRNISVMQTKVAALSSALATVSFAEHHFAKSGGVDLSIWYGRRPEAATFFHRAARFDLALGSPGSLGRYVTRARARGAV